MARMLDLRMEGLEVLRAGFYDIIDADSLQHIQSQEISWCDLQLMVNGIPEVDVEALKASTVYRNGDADLPKVKWFFQVLEGWQRYVRRAHDPDPLASCCSCLQPTPCAAPPETMIDGCATYIKRRGEPMCDHPGVRESLEEERHLGFGKQTKLVLKVFEYATGTDR